MLCAAFAGCRTEEIAHSTYSSRDFAACERLTGDLFEIMDEVARDTDGIRSRLDCIQELTVDTVSNPMTFTVDFGNDDCEGLDGQMRKGKVMCSFNGKYTDVGTTATITTDGYSLNGFEVDGHQAVTNMGLNTAGNLHYNVQMNNVEVTSPGGTWTVSWECERTREWIEGAQSEWWIDDVYLVSGVGNGVNRNGKAFKVTITDPLRVEVLCPYIVSGRLEVAPEGLSQRILEFGNGSCDPLVSLIVDGYSYTINQ